MSLATVFIILLQYKVTLLVVSVLVIHGTFKQKRSISWGKRASIASCFEHHLREGDVLLLHYASLLLLSLLPV